MLKVLSIVLNDFKNDSRVLYEAVSLKKNGFGVRVIALHEDGLKEFDDIQGVPVHRVKLKTRSLPRYLPFQLFKYIELTYKIIKNYRRVDVVHCHDLGTLPIGALIKRVFNKSTKVVYDAHEYETEMNGLKGMQKLLKKSVERLFIKSADAVITVCDTIAHEYKRLYSIPKPYVVHNCPPLIEVGTQDRFRDELGIQNDQVIFLYQGRLCEGRGVEMLLDVFLKLELSKEVIVFMGYGPLENRIRSLADKHDAIFFHEAVFSDVLLEYTASADYGISFIEDCSLSDRYCLPNKLFEYLMAGLPVLTSNLVEMKALVERYGVGVVAKENTVPSLIEAVGSCLSLDRAEIVKNICSIKKIFSWEEQERVLLSVYGDL